MLRLVASCLRNAVRARLTDSTLFEPTLPTLYLTPMCNLRCSYCELFGARRNASYRDQVLDTARMKRVIRMVADECDALYLTGGEPTLRPDLLGLLSYAARELGLRYLALNTNGLLLHRVRPITELLDNLVISLDSLEQGRWESDLVGRPERVRRLLDNIQWAAAQQHRRGFACTVTCVVYPGRVSEARRVMRFCFDIGAEFSIQHLTVERLPSPELAADPEFSELIDEMIEAKRAGRRISGSELYLRTVQNRRPFGCVPTMVPHIDHLGRVSFPCRELRDHVQVDLLSAGSLRAALAEGMGRYGPPPAECSSCPDRCYVEMSILTRHPHTLAREVAHYMSQRLVRTPD